MSSFRDARMMLLDSYDNGVIDEDEFVFLYDLNTSKNPVFPYENYDAFELENVDAAECKAEFRFEKVDLPQLAEVLGIPQAFQCDQRTVCDGMEGLCMLLRRLAYPCRYSDLIPRFGRPVPEISMITSKVADFIYNNHGYRIMRWNDTILSPDNLERYAEAIHSKGAALNNCFGFVDGTVRPICRPNANQRQVYNGHKRVHALKFQSVAIPNGLIANLYGPVEGKRHDAAMLVDSGLLESLQQHGYSTINQPMCIYGDPAYPLRVHLQAPYRQAVMTPQMQAFNTSMSAVRTSVEWLFGDIINYFKFMDFKKNLKIGLSSVGKLYIVSAILRNALTCLYKNQTSYYFNLDPPTLHDYFS